MIGIAIAGALCEGSQTAALAATAEDARQALAASMAAAVYCDGLDMNLDQFSVAQIFFDIDLTDPADKAEVVRKSEAIFARLKEDPFTETACATAEAWYGRQGRFFPNLLIRTDDDTSSYGHFSRDPRAMP
ncbi:MAG: hypothetical protein ABGW90_11715 [Martelella sp.]